MTDAATRTCYRHPGNPAGVICQRCDRPICPQCMNQASVGFQCPECAHKGAQKVIRGPQALRTRPVVTMVLIGLNVAAWAAGQAYGGGSDLLSTPDKTISWGGLFATGVRVDASNHAIGLIGVAHGQWYRLLTSGFLHVGIFHIAINMWALWVLGRVTEQVLGRLRFVLVYFVALFAGSFGALLWSPLEPSVGASGAIFGLLGALLVVARSRGIAMRDTGLISTIVLNFIITLTLSKYISVGAHVGGFIGGGIGAFLVIDAVERFAHLRERARNIVMSGVAVAVIVAFIVGSLLVADRAGGTPYGYYLGAGPVHRPVVTQPRGMPG